MFGVSLPAGVDDDTLPLPIMSDGTQKLMMEALLYPPLQTYLAEELGFRAEQTTDELVRTVLSDLSGVSH